MSLKDTLLWRESWRRGATYFHWWRNISIFPNLSTQLTFSTMCPLLSLRFVFIDKNTINFWYICDSDSGGKKDVAFGIVTFFTMWKINKHTNASHNCISNANMFSWKTTPFQFQKTLNINTFYYFVNNI